MFKVMIERVYTAIRRHFVLSPIAHLFLANKRLNHVEAKKELMLPQLRKAVDTALIAQHLSPRRQRQRLEQVAQRIHHRQQRNRAAHHAHRRKRLDELRALAIRLDQCRCCILPPEP